MKRIWIDAGRCDGCLNCTLACMNAHRGDQGTIYDLDLTNPANESRNLILRLKPEGSTAPSSAATATNRSACTPA